MPDESLDARLRKLAAAGELNYLSLVPLKSSPVYSATYSPASSAVNGFGVDADPVKAIMNAIDNYKPAKRTRTVKDDPKPARKQKAEPWE